MLDTVVKEVVSKIALFDIATGVLAISCQPYKPKIEVVCAHGLVTTALVSQRSTKGGPQWWCRASWRPAPPSRARARRSRARHRGRIKTSIGTRRGLSRRARRQRFLRPTRAARAHHSNTAHSCFVIPRELRNTCTVRDFQTPSRPETLKRCIKICLSISESIGSLDVGIYLCFVDEGRNREL